MRVAELPGAGWCVRLRGGGRTAFEGADFGLCGALLCHPRGHTDADAEFASEAVRLHGESVLRTGRPSDCADLPSEAIAPAAFRRVRFLWSLTPGLAGDPADSVRKDSGFRVVRIAGMGHQT